MKRILYLSLIVVSLVLGYSGAAKADNCWSIKYGIALPPSTQHCDDNTFQSCQQVFKIYFNYVQTYSLPDGWHFYTDKTIVADQKYLTDGAVNPCGSGIQYCYPQRFGEMLTSTGTQTYDGTRMYISMNRLIKATDWSEIVDHEFDLTSWPYYGTYQGVVWSAYSRSATPFDTGRALIEYVGTCPSAYCSTSSDCEGGTCSNNVCIN
jgi:hypothetical protein